MISPTEKNYRPISMKHAHTHNSSPMCLMPGLRYGYFCVTEIPVSHSAWIKEV